MRIHRLSRCQLYIHPFGFFAKFGKNPPVAKVFAAGIFTLKDREKALLDPWTSDGSAPKMPTFESSTNQNGQELGAQKRAPAKKRLW